MRILGKLFIPLGKAAVAPPPDPPYIEFTFIEEAPTNYGQLMVSLFSSGTEDVTMLLDGEPVVNIAGPGQGNFSSLVSLGTHTARIIGANNITSLAILYVFKILSINSHNTIFGVNFKLTVFRWFDDLLLFSGIKQLGVRSHVYGQTTIADLRVETDAVLVLMSDTNNIPVLSILDVRTLNPNPGWKVPPSFAAKQAFIAARPGVYLLCDAQPAPVFTSPDTFTPITGDLLGTVTCNISGSVFSVIPGGDSSNIQINAASGELTFIPGYTIKDSYSITVQATYNGESATQGIVIDASNVNPFPVPTLQVRTTEFEVIQVGSDYYFKALKGADYLIANCDIPVGYKGFPYKSAATIDCFGLTGVPVVSLFQNFDYGNQYFTKHVAQVVDGNGIETTQAHVSGLVEYSAPLTGDDLTAANAYYLPDAASAYWLDLANGSDANNGTTRILANKTVTGMQADITTGDVNILSGSSADSTIVATKVINWKGRGLSIIKTPATTNGVIRSDNTTNTRSFIGLIIDGQNANQWIGINTVFSNKTFTRCLFKNNKSTEIGIGSSAGGWTGSGTKINQSIITGSAVKFIRAFIDEITNSLLLGTSSDNWMETFILELIKYNKAIFTTPANKYFIFSYLGIQIEHNYFSNSGLGGIVNDSVATATQSKFNYNTVRQLDVNTYSLSSFFIKLLGTNSEVKNNNIVLSGVSASGNDNKIYVIFVSGSTTPTVNNNNIDISASSIFEIISVMSNGTTCTTAKINTNRIICRSAINAGLVQLDGEQTSARHHKFDGFEINDNICYAPAYYGNGYGTMHGLFAWANNGNMLRNYVNGAWLGLLSKGENATVTLLISHNKTINCGVSVALKGLSGSEVSDNVIDTNCNVESAFGIILVKNVAYIIHNTSIHHNSIIYRGTNAGFRLIYLDDADNLTGFTSDYNTFYTTQAYVAQVGATNYTFAQWQALGYDLHSTLLSVAPAFDESETLPV